MEPFDGNLAGGETGRVVLMKPAGRCSGEVEIDITKGAGTLQ